MDIWTNTKNFRTPLLHYSMLQKLSRNHLEGAQVVKESTQLRTSVTISRLVSSILTSNKEMWPDQRSKLAREDSVSASQYPTPRRRRWLTKLKQGLVASMSIGGWRVLWWGECTADLRTLILTIILARAVESRLILQELSRAITNPEHLLVIWVLPSRGSMTRCLSHRSDYAKRVNLINHWSVILPFLVKFIEFQLLFRE